MAGDDPVGFLGLRGEVVQVSREREGDDSPVCPVRPDYPDLLVGLDGSHAGPEFPGVCGLLGFGVPELDGLVCRGGDEAGRVGGPGDGQDGALVAFVGGEFGFEFPGLAVKEADCAVGADGDEVLAVGGEGDALHEVAVVFPELRVEFEGGTVVEDDCAVVGGGGGAVGAHGADGDAVDGVRVARDFADGVASVKGDAVAVSAIH